MNILIRNIDIVTADENNKVIKNGNIGISNGHIAFVSDSKELPEGFKADRVIEGRHRIAMPGLVNAHTHCAMTVLRNYANDLALEEWLYDNIFPVEAKMTPEDIYWGTLLGIAEMIKSGTTAFADMYLEMEGVAQAVLESGIRANLSRYPIKFDQEGKPVDGGEREKCIEYYKKWNNGADGRIKVYIEVHSAYLFNEENLRDAAQLAKSCGTGIKIHILETARERQESIQRYGMDSAEICAKCGIFDVPVIAAHCVHLSDSNIQLLKENNVNVAHNPTSNLKLGSGIARVPDMIAQGINVTIGTDGAASNNNLNMFEEMHLAAILHKGANMNASLINAGQAIRMATANGAKALGFEDAGCIKEGMKADIILLDTDQLHLVPVNDPQAAIAYSAQGQDVDTVIVDGNILMENRELKTLDEEKLKHKVREISERLLG